MNYQVINYYRIDHNNKERFDRVEFIPAAKTTYSDSHGYTYMLCRKMYQELGEVMGFEQVEAIDGIVNTLIDFGSE